VLTSKGVGTQERVRTEKGRPRTHFKRGKKKKKKKKTWGGKSRKIGGGKKVNKKPRKRYRGNLKKLGCPRREKTFGTGRIGAAEGVLKGRTARCLKKRKKGKNS